jgi:CheY-like chemotaxis protein
MCSNQKSMRVPFEKCAKRTSGAAVGGSLRRLAGARPYSILVVEDDAPDVFLLERALTRQQIDFQLTHLRDGAAGLAFVRREAPFENSTRPDLILVDLNLPRIDGEAVIREIRNARHLHGVLACVWSSSESLRDRESLNRLGVDQFIFKPSGLERFMLIGKTIKDLLSGGLEGATPAFS